MLFSGWLVVVVMAVLCVLTGVRVSLFSWFCGWALV